jgi:hypothetical protein
VPVQHSLLVVDQLDQNGMGATVNVVALSIPCSLLIPKQWQYSEPFEVSPKSSTAKGPSVC